MGHKQVWSRPVLSSCWWPLFVKPTPTRHHNLFFRFFPSILSNHTLTLDSLHKKSKNIHFFFFNIQQFLDSNSSWFTIWNFSFELFPIQAPLKAEPWWLFLHCEYCEWFVTPLHTPFFFAICLFSLVLARFDLTTKSQWILLLFRHQGITNM